jgi:hypothetical protein
VYSYLRSGDGPGHECNILTTPINKIQSVVNILTFVELMHTHQPTWQSMDLIILFYHETDYSLSVREFLDGYFSQSKSRSNSNVWEKSSEIIQGRCGYIRQSFPVVIDKWDFSKLIFSLDGINNSMSDLDFYD